MAFADLNVRDYMRLLTAFQEARTRDEKIIPTRDELIPAIRQAVEKDGHLVDNMAVVFGEPIRRGFDLVRSLISEKHGDSYTTDLWERFLRKGN